jgi:cell division protein FtsB
MKRLIAFLLVLIGLLQYRLWFGDGGIRELQQLETRIEQLKQEGEKRRERNAALEADVNDLKEGTDAVEERARQELGMVREGETYIQVLDHPAENITPLPPADPAPAKPASKPPAKAKQAPAAKPGPASRTKPGARAPAQPDSQPNPEPVAKPVEPIKPKAEPEPGAKPNPPPMEPPAPAAPLDD